MNFAGLGPPAVARPGALARLIGTTMMIMGGLALMASLTGGADGTTYVGAILLLVGALLRIEAAVRDLAKPAPTPVGQVASRPWEARDGE